MTNSLRTIPVNTPLLNGNEKKYINEALETGWISSEGPFVAKFEKEFAHFCQRKFGTAVANGTVALDLAIKALGISKGDEVIVPTFTIISCASAVVNAGAVPVFVDCGDDFNIDTSKIECLITPATKAIMAVHIYGLPTDMDEINRLAQKYNLFVIEDAAQAHGLLYKGKKCGSFGHISCFSFYPNKHITTGEGGMVLTDDPALHERLSSLRNLFFLPEKRFYHREIGTNARMTNLQAAMGCAQLERIEEKLTKKKYIGQQYLRHFSNLKYIKLGPAQGPFGENLYWVFYILLDNDHFLDAQKVMAKLQEKKIGTRPFFYPLHQQPCFQVYMENDRYNNTNFCGSNDLYNRGFYLPSGLGLTDEDINYVSEQVIELLG